MRPHVGVGADGSWADEKVVETGSHLVPCLPYCVDGRLTGCISIRLSNVSNDGQNNGHCFAFTCYLATLYRAAVTWFSLLGPLL